MKWKQLGLNLALAFSSVLVMVAVLEGGTRLLTTVRPGSDRFQLSPLLGWEWNPGYAAIEHYKGVDYRMAISSQGLRNEIVVVPKPQGTYRIIALGDSITEGPGVELEETFVKQIERALQAENEARPVEVIDAGTGDYGTEQELIWLRERGLAYEPDLVILNVYLNDPRSFGPPSPRLASLSNFLSDHSALYAFYQSIVRQQLVSQQQAGPCQNPTDFRFYYLDAWERGEWMNDAAALTELIQAADDDWGLAWYDEAIGRMEGQILEMAQLAREHEFALLLVLFPVQVQVYAQVETPLGLDEPQMELRRFAESAGLPVVDLLPLLRANQGEDLYFDQAHLKEIGHQLVAGAVVEELREMGLPPP